MSLNPILHGGGSYLHAAILTSFLAPVGGRKWRNGALTFIFYLFRCFCTKKKFHPVTVRSPRGVMKKKLFPKFSNFFFWKFWNHLKSSQNHKIRSKIKNFRFFLFKTFKIIDIGRKIGDWRGHKNGKLKSENPNMTPYISAPWGWSDQMPRFLKCL